MSQISPVEILSLQNKNSFRIWLNSSKFSKKEYDNQCKTYILELNKHNLETNKNMNFPETHVILQAYIYSKNNAVFEFGVIDTDSLKKRIIFTSAIKDIIRHEMHVRIPFSSFPVNKWINLELDLESSFKYFSNKIAFKSIDYMNISFEGKVRKICLLRNSIKEMIILNNTVPKVLQMPIGVDVENVIVRLGDSNVNYNSNLNSNNVNSNIVGNYFEMKYNKLNSNLVSNANSNINSKNFGKESSSSNFSKNSYISKNNKLTKLIKVQSNENNINMNNLNNNLIKSNMYNELLEAHKQSNFKPIELSLSKNNNNTNTYNNNNLILNTNNQIILPKINPKTNKRIIEGLIKSKIRENQLVDNNLINNRKLLKKMDQKRTLLVSNGKPTTSDSIKTSTNTKFLNTLDYKANKLDNHFSQINNNEKLNFNSNRISNEKLDINSTKRSDNDINCDYILEDIKELNDITKINYDNNNNNNYNNNNNVNNNELNNKLENLYGFNSIDRKFISNYKIPDSNYNNLSKNNLNNNNSLKDINVTTENNNVSKDYTMIMNKPLFNTSILKEDLNNPAEMIKIEDAFNSFTPPYQD